jgi:hypothetical protein
MTIGNRTETRTIRQACETKIDDFITDAMRKWHEGYYETLYVSRDGSIWWDLQADANTYLRDADATRIPSLIKVGTGLSGCNCDWCASELNLAEEIEDNVETRDTFRSRMSEELEAIPVGYFYDEAEGTLNSVNQK